MGYAEPKSTYKSSMSTSLHRKPEVASTAFCWPGKRVTGEMVRSITAVY